jgi:hypothetical protein
MCDRGKEWEGPGMNRLFPADWPVWTLCAIAGLLAAAPAARAGRVVNVPADATLQSAVLNALADDEIVIAPGTYYPTVYLNISANGVKIRGATGDRDDVIVSGPGMNVSSAPNKEGFQLYADNITIKDLTVQEFYFHAIHFQSGADGVHIQNVRCANNGDQQIKGARLNIGGLIENTLCELTYVRTNDGGVTRPDDYVGGIDLHGGINFTIRDCIVRNIQGAGGDSDGAIFAWNGSANVTVERCLVFGCNRGICFGNNSGGRNGYDVDGGIARNNFVWARTTPRPGSTTTPWLYDADCAVDTYACRNVKVYNNTIWTDSGSYGRTVRSGTGTGGTTPVANSNVQFMYNIIRGQIKDYNPVSCTSTGDITGNVAQPNWFFDAANANFHLTKLATAAIDHAVPLAEVPADCDQQSRPIGSAPDVGADEYVAADITGDGHVDIADLLILAGTFGKSSGQPGYNGAADLNASSTVDVSDLLILAVSWGM